MPVSYVWDEDRIMTWTASEPMSTHDWGRAFNKAERDPVIQRIQLIGMIVDVRARTVFQGPAAVQAFAADVRGRLARLHIYGFPVAVVVASAIAHGLTRMTEAYVGDGLEVGIFRDTEHAREWLLAVDASTQ